MVLASRQRHDALQFTHEDRPRVRRSIPLAELAVTVFSPADDAPVAHACAAMVVAQGELRGASDAGHGRRRTTRSHYTFTELPFAVVAPTMDLRIR